MVKKKKWVLCIVLYMFCIFQIGHAEEKNISISFNPELPKNQKKGVKGYFDLSLEKGQKQTVYIVVHNPTSEIKKVNIYASNGLTNQNGGIHYTRGEGSEQSYILDNKFLIKQYIKVPDTITIDPNSDVKVPIQLSSPYTEGTYIGGVLFSEVQTEENKNEDAIEFNVNQETLYGIALQFTIGKEEKINFSFNDAKIEQSPSGIFLNLNFENRAAQLLNNVSGSFIVQKDDKIIFKGSLEEFNMAPKTGIFYPIPWNAEEIKEGKYQLLLDMNIDGRQKMIKEEMQFLPTKTDIYENEKVPVNNHPEIKEDNEKSKVEESIKENEQSDEKKISFWIWIVLTFVVFGMGYYLGKRKKQ